jgi:hypothetical protein
VAAHGLGVVADDFDEDGWPDLYVANDGDANMLWMNRRDGTFADEAVTLGAAYNARGVALAGMGVVAADLDGDGALDLFVTNLDRETNSLYRGLGPGRGFQDDTDVAGVGLDSWDRTGFGVVAIDAELDGDLDLFIANGRVKVADEPHPLAARLPEPWNGLAEPNLFHSNEGGSRFRLATAEAGDLCAGAAVSRGVATGDVDGDGDLDLLVGTIHGPARLYRNDAPRHGEALLVQAFDPRLRRDAVGARVTIEGGGRRQVRTITGGFSYLSSSPPVAHFGIPRPAEVESVEVRWPDGLVERFPAEPASGTRRLVRGSGEAVP